MPNITLQRIERIQVAIQLHLRGMRADGVRPPRPRRRTVGAGQDIETGRFLRNRRGCRLRRADTVDGSPPNKRMQPTARRGAPRLIRSVSQTRAS